jgi:hypothetical protein
MIDRRIDQAGRADHLLDEHAAGRSISHGRASPRRRRLRAHRVPFLERSGRLSMQEGRRKPYSASVALRRKSPRYMPPICGTVTWLSSANTSALSGRYSNRSAAARRAAAGEIARIVLDAGAGAGGFHHFEIEGGALLQPLRFQQLALALSWSSRSSARP